jgi:CheY-like chemotaxis protein
MNFELLLIDDDEIFLYLNEMEIQRSGFFNEPIKFADCTKALEYLKSNDSAEKKYLLMLDINMPVLDGWDFLKVLRRFNLDAQIKVIMLAASVDPRDQIKTKAFPEVISYLEKPLTKANLDRLTELEALADYLK